MLSESTTDESTIPVTISSTSFVNNSSSEQNSENVLVNELDSTKETVDNSTNLINTNVKINSETGQTCKDVEYTQNQYENSEDSVIDDQCSAKTYPNSDNICNESKAEMSLIRDDNDSLLDYPTVVPSKEDQTENGCTEKLSEEFQQNAEEAETDGNNFKNFNTRATHKQNELQDMIQQKYFEDQLPSFLKPDNLTVENENKSKQIHDIEHLKDDPIVFKHEDNPQGTRQENNESSALHNENKVEESDAITEFFIGNCNIHQDETPFTQHNSHHYPDGCSYQDLDNESLLSAIDVNFNKISDQHVEQLLVNEDHLNEPSKVLNTNMNNFEGNTEMHNTTVTSGKRTPEDDVNSKYKEYNNENVGVPPELANSARINEYSHTSNMEVSDKENDTVPSHDNYSNTTSVILTNNLKQECEKHVNDQSEEQVKDSNQSREDNVNSDDLTKEQPTGKAISDDRENDTILSELVTSDAVSTLDQAELFTSTDNALHVHDPTNDEKNLYINEGNKDLKEIEVHDDEITTSSEDLINSEVKDHFKLSTNNSSCESTDIINDHKQGESNSIIHLSPPFQIMVDDTNKSSNQITSSETLKKNPHGACSFAESITKSVEESCSKQSEFKITLNDLDQEYSRKALNDQALVNGEPTRNETNSENIFEKEIQFEKHIVQTDEVVHSEHQALLETINHPGDAAISLKNSERIMKSIADNKNTPIIETSGNFEVFPENNVTEKNCISDRDTMNDCPSNETVIENKENIRIDFTGTPTLDKLPTGNDSLLNSKLEHVQVMLPLNDTGTKQVSDGIKELLNLDDLQINTSKIEDFMSHKIETNKEQKNKIVHPISAKESKSDHNQYVKNSDTEEVVKYSKENFHTDWNITDLQRSGSLTQESVSIQKEVSSCEQTPLQALTAHNTFENEGNKNSLSTKPMVSENTTEHMETSETITENTVLTFLRTQTARSSHKFSENDQVSDISKSPGNYSTKFDKQKPKTIIIDQTTDVVPRDSENEYKVPSEIELTGKNAMFDEPLGADCSKCAYSNVEESKLRKPETHISNDICLTEEYRQVRNATDDKTQFGDTQASLGITPDKLKNVPEDISLHPSQNSTETEIPQESKSNCASNTPVSTQVSFEHNYDLTRRPQTCIPICNMQYIINFSEPNKLNQNLTANEEDAGARKLYSNRGGSSQNSFKNTPDNAKKNPVRRVTPPVIPTIMSPISIFKRSLTGNIISPCGGRTCHTRPGAESANVQNIPTISCPTCISTFGDRNVSAEGANMATAPKSPTSPQHVNQNTPCAANARRRLQFLSKAAATNNENDRSPKRATQHNFGEGNGCHKSSSLMDWYPGYRFYIMKP